MWIVDTSVRRPVLASVISLLILLGGVIGLVSLSVREYPDIDPPIVSVSTIYPGANPRVIETSVTELLEEELNAVDGLKTMTSTSQEEASNIVLEFEAGRDIELAAQDTRDAVARVRGRLPDEVEDPITTKQDVDAQAVMWLSLYGEGLTPLEISDYARRTLVDRIQTVPGVARVIIGGERAYAMRLWLDPQKMAARRVNVSDVQAALAGQNIELPSGRVEGPSREFTVRTLGEMHTPEAFNRLVVRTGENGTPVYFSDIGRAEVGARTDRSLVRYNGIPAVGLGIVKQSKANTLAVAHGVKDRMAELRDTLPAGLKMNIGFDSSLFIERALAEVTETLYLAGFLVILVIFAFLGNWRATLVPTLAIPVSIIGTFGILAAFGFSINTITLLGLILAIGLVVDDTIVVLENVYRHLEMGKPPMQAALEGTKEVGFAVVAATLALVAVFVPLALMPGVTGRLFTEFSIAVSASVLISGVVALTLAPVLCGLLLKAPAASSASGHLDGPALTRPHRHSHWGSRFSQGWQRVKDGFFGVIDKIMLGFNALLAWSLAHRWKTLGALVVLVLLAVVSNMFTAKEFLPTEDRGLVFNAITAPEGATLAYTDRAVRKAEKVYANTPEVFSYFSVIALSQQGPGAVNNGIIFVNLHPWEERKRKQQEIVQGLFPVMSQISEASVFPLNLPSGPVRGFGKPLQLVVQGSDLEQLGKTATRIAEKAAGTPGMINVENELRLNKPQLQVNLRRDRTAMVGVSPRELADTMQVMLGSREMGTFEVGGKRYDVMAQAQLADRDDPSDISSLYVRGRNNQMVPLSQVVTLEETVGPKAITHYQRLRSATVSAALLPFLPLGAAMEKIEPIARQEIGSDMRLAWAGEANELQETSSATLLVFLVALVVAYLVLAAQFESFRDPFIVLVTVPLAVCGGFISLFLTGVSLSIYAQIGMILLIGLVTKNGILIVEYANHLLAEHPGISTADAVAEATRIRLRPILMTALTAVLGTLPLALALGAGSEGRQGLGIVVVGGLLLSTMLTLFVLPVVYVMIKKRQPV